MNRLLALVVLWVCRPSAVVSVRDAVLPQDLVEDMSETMCALKYRHTKIPLYFSYCAQDGVTLSSRLCGECIVTVLLKLWLLYSYVATYIMIKISTMNFMLDLWVCSLMI